MRTTGRREAGLTLVEVAVSSVILAVVSVVVIQMIRGVGSNSRYLQEKLRAGSLAERVIGIVRDDITYSAALFQESSDSRNYLARMALGRTPLAGSRMPRASTLGYFDRDPSRLVETGNLLFLVCGDPKVVLDVSADSTPDPHRVDMYRFVVWFLTVDGKGLLDLHRWASVPLARYQDVEAIADEARRTRTCLALRAEGVRHLLDGAGDASTGVYQIQDDGSFALLDPSATVPADGEVTEWSLLGTRHLAVAHNADKPPYPLPRFAQPTSQFPHGFEVKVDGNGEGGLAWVRLTVATERGQRRGAAEREAAFQEQ